MQKIIILFLGVFVSSVSLAQANVNKPQPRVVVQEISDRSASGGEACGFYRMWATPGGAIRELLTDELLNRGGFTVLEREHRSDLYQSEMAEENLDEDTKVAKKKFIAANLAIAGTISEFEWCMSGQDQEVDLGGLIGLGGLSVGHQSSTAHVAFDLRLIEVSTGKILKTFKSSGAADDSGFSLKAGLKGVRYTKESFGKTPMGKANRIAIANAAEQISAAIKEYK